MFVLSQIVFVNDSITNVIAVTIPIHKRQTKKNLPALLRACFEICQLFFYGSFCA